MRRLLLLLSVLSLIACKKDRPAVAPSAQKCTQATLHVADPERCETSCFAGEVAACDVASSLFHRGLHVRRDPGRALSVAAKGCDLGGAQSCASVAVVLSGRYDHEWPDAGVYENAELRADYEKKARAAAERECGAGRFESCALATELIEGADAEPLAKKAVELMQKGCDAKDALACARLATAYTVGGVGLGRDPAKATALHTTACELGQAEACEQAALATPPGEARRKLVQRGCDLGSGASCLLWGLELEGPAAADAVKRGCELRDGQSCLRLSRAGEDADKYLKRACAVGLEAACAD